MARTSEGTARAHVVHAGGGALVGVEGVIDEAFPGFGDLRDAKFLVVDLGGVTRMTSFGVARWLAALERLPKTITDFYLLRCPTVFVDQLNMVLGFGGAARVITFFAPYLCPSCRAESTQTIDVPTTYSNLARGVAPERKCERCSATLELDESAESFFGFVERYGATVVNVEVARVLAEKKWYRALTTTSDKPPRVIKLIHDAVTYFRIIGTIGEAFRARPFLVGAEGEVVIDLAELENFDPAGLSEWKRLLKSLSSQVTAVTIVDVTRAVLQHAGETLAHKNVSVASVLVPFKCAECGRSSPTSHALSGPLKLKPRVCPTCGGASTCELSIEELAPLDNASTSIPDATRKVIQRRTELLSRAVTDANVAMAGDTSPAQSGELIFGKYRILRPLSAGGMAEVFLANQIGIGGFEKAVALKRIQRKLLESRQMAVDMFLNEAKIAGRLTHPNIVQVLDVGEAGGALYLAMEYVRGKDLREVIKRQRQTSQRLPLAIACHIVREIASALHHAYWTKDMQGNRLAVVHRDVTPHNVILSFEGQIKLLDFGVAMSAVTEQADSLIVGKWSYMSPEHSSGGKLDHRSDLFSLGVILYLLITGTMPFPGTDPRDIVRKTREGKFIPVLDHYSDLPVELADLATRLLAIDPAHRPQTGQEVAKQLDRIMSEYELTTSAPQIAEMLAHLFTDEKSSRGRGPLDDLTQKISGLALGSGPTGNPDDSGSRSPVSFSQSLGPGSASASLKPRGTATLVDDSVSFSNSRPPTNDGATEIYAADRVRARTAELVDERPGHERAPTHAPTVVATPPPDPARAAAPAPARAATQAPARASTAAPARAATSTPSRVAAARGDRKGKPAEASAVVAILVFIVLAGVLFLIVRYV